MELDLEQFRRTRNKSIGFGAITAIVPLAVGTAIGLGFGLNLTAAVLVGSLFSAHTLLGYPIVNRLGVVNNEAVTVAIGSTIFADIAALLILAVCVSIGEGEFSLLSLVIQLVELVIYSIAVLFGFDRMGKAYFRRTPDDEGNQFLFILLVVFLASVAAQLIRVELIVGAFLAGIAVNDVVGDGPVKEKVEFLGSVLFIPFFFVNMGLLVRIPAFVSSLSSGLGLTLAMLVGVMGSKFIAAVLAKWFYGYSWDATLTMWSLTLPHVAATLAAAIIGLRVGLLDQAIFNSAIVLMLVTAILGPLLTDRFANRLSFAIAHRTAENPQTQNVGEFHPSTILVPISNPNTDRHLIEMAALLARHESGSVLPLVVLQTPPHMDEPEVTVALAKGQQQLDTACAIARAYEVQVYPECRIYDRTAHGISRTAREKDVRLIVMGWSEQSSISDRLFGNLIDRVFWLSHCPVAVTRLLDDPVRIHRILVPVRDLSPPTLRTVDFALLFADTHQAKVTLLHIYNRRTPPEQVEGFKSSLADILSGFQRPVDVKIKIVLHDDVAQVLLRVATAFDMVILRSMRRRTSGGLALSSVTTQAIETLTCSIVLFGEPHS